MRNKQNMHNRFSTKLSLNALSICFLSLMVLPIHAEEKTEAEIKAAEIIAAEIKEAAEIKAAVEKKLLSKIEINKPESDPAASEVFRAPIYKVRPELGYIAVVDGEVLNLNKPSSSYRLPGYQKLIRDDFVLDSEEKANTLASALQLTFPYKLNKIVKPVKVKHGWIVFRGKFFKDYSGLVFTTDEKGKITLVEYVLKINPKDYSYKPPTE